MRNGFFTEEEFACKCGKCGPIPDDAKLAIGELVKNLNVLRAAVKSPITITSGFRCLAHNKAVGGASDSRHMKGQAADLQIAGKSPTFVHGMLEGLIAVHEIVDGGVGVYGGFIHFDIGPSRRWYGK